jgi:hypothetical protein
MQNSQQMLQDILEYINISENNFNTGAVVDMQLLDIKVHHFCDIIAHLPAAEAKKYSASLDVIIERLKPLIQKIELHKSELEDKIHSINKRNIAYNAYGNAMILALQSVGENNDK